MADSISSGNSSSTSSSTSTPFQGPERDFLLQLAQYSEGLEQQMFNWANTQFAGTSAVTDQAVNNFFNASQKAMGQADQMWDRYVGTFQPLENNLVQEANSFAGAGRIAAEMGRAGATSTQAMDQQRQAALRDLESYGVDPSSGRYAGLDRAERLMGAAAGAGAENQARLATEQTGRNLRSEAIQVGQRYPQQVAQAEGLGLNSLTGAVNSKLANLATGAQAFGPAEKFGAEAASLKYPPMMPQSQSQGRSNQSSNSNSPSGSRASQQAPRAPGSGGSGPGSGGGTSFSPAPGRGGVGSGSQGGGSGYQQPNPGFLRAGGGNNTNDNQFPSWDTSYTEGEGYNTPAGSDVGDSWNIPEDNYGLGNNYDFGYGGGSTSGGSDPSWDTSYTEGGGYNDASALPGESWYDSTATDESYAEGGQVPMDASPSGGAETDDVAARLNAGEFVVPRDVAQWKGHEFFQNLITKSRQARGAAPAKPQMKPALQRQPSFTSQHMGA